MGNKIEIPKYSTIVRLTVDQDEMYYIAAHPEIEGCFSDGATVEEALTNLEEVTIIALEHLYEHKFAIPAPQPLFVSPAELDQRRALPLKDTQVEKFKYEMFPVSA